MHDSAQYFCYLWGPLCSVMLKGLDFAYTHRQMRRVYIRISISRTAHIWQSHFAKTQFCNKGCVSLQVCVLKATCRAGADEVRGCVSFYNVYKCAAVVIYLVSFVPNLPLLSRDPNFTLTERGQDECAQEDG